MASKAPKAALVAVGRKRVASVERALQLLKSFIAPNEYLSLSMLAQRSELNKATILRLMSSLGHMGFVGRNEKGQFYLGPEIHRLGLMALERTPRPLEAVVRPALQRLVACTDGSASLYVLDGNQRVCLFRENSPSLKRQYLEEGSGEPLEGGASAQVLKAFISDPKNPRSRSVQKAGWVISRGGRYPELISIAVPIRDARSRVFGAIGISGSVDKLSPSRIDRARRFLIREAQELSARLSER